MDRAQRLVSNIAYNFLSQAWLAALNLVTLPYIVRQLGVDAYGVLVMVTVVVGYLAFLDLGLGSAVQKYVAEYYAKRDFKALEATIGTATVVYVVVGLLGALGMAGFAGLLVDRLLRVPAELQEVTRVAFYIGSIGVLASMPLSVFAAVPLALQRFDLAGKRNLLIGTVNTLLTVALLAMGYGLREIVLVNVLLNVVSVLVFVIVTRQLLPEISLLPRFRMESAKSLYSFALFKFVGQLSGMAVFQLDRLLVGLFLPIGWVSYYAVPLTFSQKIMTAVGNISGPLFPAATELHSLGLTPSLQRLYIRAMKVIAAIAIPTSVVLIVFADKILLFWAGPDFADKSSLTLRLLAGAFLLIAFTPVPALVADGVGRPRINAVASSLSAVLNVILCLALIPTIGIDGAALALLVNQVIVVPFFLLYVNKNVVRLPVRDFLGGAFIRPFLLGALLAVLLMLAHDFASNVLILVVELMTGACVYLIGCFALNVIDRRDHDAIQDWLARSYRGSWNPFRMR
ncbi:MAG: flippase [Dehalococcoidales bacterium]|nr:flippase [Dehalococcoidales bacterium]